MVCAHDHDVDLGHPRAIGRFDAIALLAHGGMASVYLAEERPTGRRVALKVLSPRFAASDEVVVRFLGEREVSRRVQHQGLVRVLDAVRDDGSGVPHLVIELVDGDCLGGLIDQGRIEVGAIAAMGAQIADAMAALHQARIAHCDLKPDNVLVLGEPGLAGWPRIKVVDFGVAHFLDDGGGLADDRIVGTPAYMSPEQWRGRVDERTDIYALGCLLYELCVGHPPFDGGLAELMTAHSDALPAPPHRARADVPRELDRAILRMLAKDARMRPRSMREIARDLTDLAFAIPPGARMPAELLVVG